MIKNSFISLIQSLISLFSLFFTYKFIISSLGVEQLGLWSLLVSIIALIRVAECGYSGSVIKFISASIANNNVNETKSVLETSVISVGFFIGLAAFIFFFPIKFLLPHFILNQFFLLIAYQLLPICFLSLWISSIAGIYKASLEGYQRYDLSMYATILSTITFIIAVINLIPEYKLYGLAFSVCIQGFALLFSSIFFINFSIELRTTFPISFSKRIFNEMIGYGNKYQLISFIMILVEPLTKGMLGHYGTLSMVGYFEMANKVITQMRGLLLSMNQVIVPKVAFSKETGKLDLKSLYEKNFGLIVYISIPFYITILSLIPLIQDLWLDDRSLLFQIVSIISIITWFINTLSVPAYFINMGTGDLNWNVYSHLMIGILNIMLSFILGWRFGGIGVIAAWSFSIVIGSLVLIYYFHCNNGVTFSALSKINFINLIIGMLTAIISWGVYYNLLNLNFYLTLCLYFFVISLFVFCTLWFNSHKQFLISSAKLSFKRSK